MIVVIIGLVVRLPFPSLAPKSCLCVHLTLSSLLSLAVSSISPTPYALMLHPTPQKKVQAAQAAHIMKLQAEAAAIRCSSALLLWRIIFVSFMCVFCGHAYRYSCFRAALFTLPMPVINRACARRVTAVMVGLDPCSR